jgi:hypothetical protein
VRASGGPATSPPPAAGYLPSSGGRATSPPPPSMPAPPPLLLCLPSPSPSARPSPAVRSSGGVRCGGGASRGAGDGRSRRSMSAMARAPPPQDLRREVWRRREDLVAAASYISSLFCPTGAAVVGRWWRPCGGSGLRTALGGRGVPPPVSNGGGDRSSRRPQQIWR